VLETAGDPLDRSTCEGAEDVVRKKEGENESLVRRGRRVQS